MSDGSKVQRLTQQLENLSLDNPKRLAAVRELADSFRDTFYQTRSEEDLEASIHLYKIALNACPPNHPDRCAILVGFSRALAECGDGADSRADLDEMITFFRELLAQCPSSRPDRGDLLTWAANTLTVRYTRTGAWDDLAEVITLQSHALEFYPIGHPLRAKPLYNLANSLSIRYGMTHSHADLDEMIHLFEAAVSACPVDHPNRGMVLNGLACAFGQRFYRDALPRDLEAAMTLHQDALNRCPIGHPSRIEILNNLAFNFGVRFYHFHETKDLDQAIQLHQEALELCPVGISGRSMTLSFLATAMLEKFQQNGSQALLKQVININTEALELYFEDDPRFARAAWQLAKSLSLLDEGYSRADEIVDLLRTGSGQRCGTSPLNDSLTCALFWVEWAQIENHESLEESYVNAVEFLRHYLTIGPTAKLQYESLMRRSLILTLPMDAAADVLRDGNQHLAVEMLDEGRSLLWTEMRRFREPLSRQERALLGEDIARRFESVCSELQVVSTSEARYEDMAFAEGSGGGSKLAFPRPNVGASYGSVLTKKRKLLEQYQDLIFEIQNVPGLHRFPSRRPWFWRLREAASEGPVVIISCSRRGSHIIIMQDNEKPTVLDLREDFYKVVSQIRNSYIEALQEAKDSRDPSKTLSLRLMRIAQQLWDLFVSRIVDTLRELGVAEGSRIWLCPTSFLTLLPLHAAGSDGCFLIDYYIPSYTPTLMALIDARRPFSPTPPEKELAKPSILVVAQTESSRLAKAKQEFDVMLGLGPFVRPMNEEEASRESVLQSLPNHDWAHFICHGTVSDNPFDSALVIYKSMLSLNDIIQAHLPNAKFAFLAACHTAEQGRGDAILQDEVFHVAAAIQFSGFRSVVGTMWEMLDKDGAKIAQVFYEEMLKGDEKIQERHKRAARALWLISKRMKDKGISMDRWANFVHIGA